MKLQVCEYCHGRGYFPDNEACEVCCACDGYGFIKIPDEQHEKDSIPGR